MGFVHDVARRAGLTECLEQLVKLFGTFARQHRDVREDSVAEGVEARDPLPVRCPGTR
jgi:hypothetical protein